MVMLTQNDRNLTSRSKKIHTVAKNLWRQNIALTGVALGRGARATVHSAQLKAVTDELASVKMKLDTRRVRSAISCWSSHSIAKDAI